MNKKLPGGAAGGAFDIGIAFNSGVDRAPKLTGRLGNCLFFGSREGVAAAIFGGSGPARFDPGPFSQKGGLLKGQGGRPTPD